MVFPRVGKGNHEHSFPRGKKKHGERKETKPAEVARHGSISEAGIKNWTLS